VYEAAVDATDALDRLERTSGGVRKGMGWVTLES
jgi:hypothetical protein